MSEIAHTSPIGENIDGDLTNWVQLSDSEDLDGDDTVFLEDVRVFCHGDGESESPEIFGGYHAQEPAGDPSNRFTLTGTELWERSPNTVDQTANGEWYESMLLKESQFAELAGGQYVDLSSGEDFYIGIEEDQGGTYDFYAVMRVVP